MSAQDSIPSETVLTGFRTTVEESMRLARPCLITAPALLALVECAEALKELSAMYIHAWDLVDGGLMMMEPSIAKFESVHGKADDALAKLESLK